MKTTLISVLASSLVVFTSALPTASPQSDPSAASIITVTLFGATPEAQYSISVPPTGDFTLTNNELSISHVQTSGGPCGLFGVDQLIQEIDTAGYVDVGAPQTIVGVACGPKKGENGW
ncbi:hypothetical protein DV736_g235, partial [Chaetothyriales sp. CBS 134916]